MQAPGSQRPAMQRTGRHWQPPCLRCVLLWAGAGQGACALAGAAGCRRNLVRALCTWTPSTAASCRKLVPEDLRQPQACLLTD